MFATNSTVQPAKADAAKRAASASIGAIKIEMGHAFGSLGINRCMAKVIAIKTIGGTAKRVGDPPNPGLCGNLMIRKIQTGAANATRSSDCRLNFGEMVWSAMSSIGRR